MKVIFLDNDGVICLDTNWGSRTKKWKEWLKTNPDSLLLKDAPVQYRFDNFDKKAIKVLNEIILETNAEIVVSSDWKKHANLEELGNYYVEQGIIKRPIDITPNLSEFDPNTGALFYYKNWYEKTRILEIKEWLKNNNVDAWVAIDDLDMSKKRHEENGLDNFVLCTGVNQGLKRLGLKKKIISFLNN